MTHTIITEEILDSYTVPTGPGLYRYRKDVPHIRSLHYPFGAHKFTQWITPGVDLTEDGRVAVNYSDALFLLVDARPFALLWVERHDAIEHKVLCGEKLCGLIQIVSGASRTDNKSFLTYFEKVE